MDDNSFISGLSSIGDAIGESSYGRSITVWILQCEPALPALAIRLGGPGSSWRTVDLPMPQPVTLHRPSTVRIPRRATELAVATLAYAEAAATTAAEAADEQPNRSMAAMDVLMNTASSVAQSILIGATADDVAVVELMAADVPEKDGAPLPSPLHLHLRWAVGEVLPGAPMPVYTADTVDSVEAALATGVAVEPQGSISSAAVFAETRRGPSAIDDDIHAATPITPTGAGTVEGRVLGEEDSTPSSSTKLSPTSNHSMNPAAPLPAVQLRNGNADETESSSRRPSQSFKITFPKEEGDAFSGTLPCSSTGTRPFVSPGVSHDESEGINAEVPPTMPPSVSASRVPVPPLPRPSSADPHHRRRLSDAAAAYPIAPPVMDTASTASSEEAPALLSREESEGIAIGPGNEPLTPPQGIASSNSNGYASSSKSNTPRRPRPHLGRRSTVQISLAPVDVPEEPAAGGGGHRRSTDPSVEISSDDDTEIPRWPMPSEEMHRPPPPPPPSKGKTAPRQTMTDHSSHPVAAAAAVSTPVRGNAGNLFAGAAASDVVVMVAVTALRNTSGDADPNRIVSVAVNASASTEFVVSFGTAPALRRVAAVVPQLAEPTLLCPPRGMQYGSDDDRDDPSTPLQATCTLTELVRPASESATATSTVLWTTAAELRLGEAEVAGIAAAPLTKEVCFAGVQGDIVVTQWTYTTVAAYRDAALNLCSRSGEVGAAALEVLLVVDDASKKNLGPRTAMGTAMHVWVSSPSYKEEAVQHRLVVASPVNGLVQQPVRVAINSPLLYVAIAMAEEFNPASAAASATGTLQHTQLILFPAFSNDWTSVSMQTDKKMALFYRIVDATSPTAGLIASASLWPAPFAADEWHHTSGAATQEKKGHSGDALRELCITFQPPTSSAPYPCTIVLRHAASHQVLASASADGPLTYRCFLPLSSMQRTSTLVTTTGSGSAHLRTGGGESVTVPRLQWEVLLLPSSTVGTAGETPSATPKRRGSRGSTHIPNRRGSSPPSRTVALASANAATAWFGTMLLPHAPLYAVSATTTDLHGYACISAPAPPSHQQSVLRSAAEDLGARVNFTCVVRPYSLAPESAVFCLRALRLVASPLLPDTVVASTVTPVPAQLRMWFAASGGATEAAVGEELPLSEAAVRHAWAPTESSSCSPMLSTDGSGKVQPTPVPVLLATTNKRARLCIAVAAAFGVAGVTDSVVSDDVAESVLRGTVAAVRKRAIRRYKKSHAAEKDAQQMAEVDRCCSTAVAMRVDNYVEVDLTPSLVAASERAGYGRHRLLLSSVSGTVRISRDAVLELQGQWVKLPRTVATVPEAYVPSARLWALRCSCVVRRESVVAAGVGAGGRERANVVPLAQEVLEAERGYEVIARSVPLEETDPTEETVQKVLPGLSYDKLIVQTKREDTELHPLCEVIASSTAAVASQEAPMLSTAISEEMSELLEHVFGPTGVAHEAYISHASHKVAVVHFIFGDAYTTRTALQVTCAAATGAVIATSPSSSFSMGILSDGLLGSSTLYNFLPEPVVTRLFPEVSHRRYPPELTWYHGRLGLDAATTQERRQQAQTAWRHGLTEQQLGPLVQPGPLAVSAVTHHPSDRLPLVVEGSLTRCRDGEELLLFGGVSTVTGAASSRAFAFDGGRQMWVPLRCQPQSRRGRHPAGRVSRSSPLFVPPRYGHTAAYRPADGATYVFGGRGRPEMPGLDSPTNSDSSLATSEDAGSAPVYDDVWRLDWNSEAGLVAATELSCGWAETEPNSVTTLDPDVGLARWRHSAAIYNDYLIVLGGQSSSGVCCSCRDLLFLDLTSKEWCVRRSFGADAPSPRYGHAAAVSELTTLYLFGGSSTETGTSSRRSDDKKPRHAAAAQPAVLADFYKLDLVTRMWTAVDANGPLRPPPLELADMTTCKIDGCPVLLLVGGRVDGESSTSMHADMGVYLFSTATLFWRQVRMDCTPVPTRFGLKVAVGVGAHGGQEAGTGRGNATSPLHSNGYDTARVRRSLPSRGQRLADVVVVGGLPLAESEMTETAPAITLVLATGTTTMNRANGLNLLVTATPPPRPATAGARHRTFSQANGGSSSLNRPGTLLGGGPHRPGTSQLRPTPAWAQTQPQHGRQSWAATGDITPPPVPIRSPATSLRPRHGTVHAIPVAGRSGSIGPTPPSTTRRRTCYSTLTVREQRGLVYRLYTEDLIRRQTHLHRLQEQVHHDLTMPSFATSQPRGRSPIRHPGPPTRPRMSSAPVRRGRLYQVLDVTPSPAERHSARQHESTTQDTDAPVARRNLRMAFLSRSSSSSDISGTEKSSSSAESEAHSLTEGSVSHATEEETVAAPKCSSAEHTPKPQSASAAGGEVTASEENLPGAWTMLGGAGTAPVPVALPTASPLTAASDAEEEEGDDDYTPPESTTSSEEEEEREEYVAFATAARVTPGALNEADAPQDSSHDAQDDDRGRNSSAPASDLRSPVDPFIGDKEDEEIDELQSARPEPTEEPPAARAVSPVVAESEASAAEEVTVPVGAAPATGPVVPAVAEDVYSEGDEDWESNSEEKRDTPLEEELDGPPPAPREHDTPTPSTRSATPVPADDADTVVEEEENEPVPELMVHEEAVPESSVADTPSEAPTSEEEDEAADLVEEEDEPVQAAQADDYEDVLSEAEEDAKEASVEETASSSSEPSTPRSPTTPPLEEEEEEEGLACVPSEPQDTLSDAPLEEKEAATPVLSDVDSDVLALAAAVAFSADDSDGDAAQMEEATLIPQEATPSASPTTPPPATPEENVDPAGVANRLSDAAESMEDEAAPPPPPPAVATSSDGDEAHVPVDDIPVALSESSALLSPDMVSLAEEEGEVEEPQDKTLDTALEDSHHIHEEKEVSAGAPAEEADDTSDIADDALEAESQDPSAEQSAEEEEQQEPSEEKMPTPVAVTPLASPSAPPLSDAEDKNEDEASTLGAAESHDELLDAPAEESLLTDEEEAVTSEKEVEAAEAQPALDASAPSDMSAAPSPATPAVEEQEEEEECASNAAAASHDELLDTPREDSPIHDNEEEEEEEESRAQSAAAESSVEADERHSAASSSFTAHSAGEDERYTQGELSPVEPAALEESMQPEESDLASQNPADLESPSLEKEEEREETAEESSRAATSAPASLPDEDEAASAAEAVCSELANASAADAADVFPEADAPAEEREEEEWEDVSTLPSGVVEPSPPPLEEDMTSAHAVMSTSPPPPATLTDQRSAPVTPLLLLSEEEEEAAELPVVPAPEDRVLSALVSPLLKHSSSAASGGSEAELETPSPLPLAEERVSALPSPSPVPSVKSAVIVVSAHATSPPPLSDKPSETSEQEEEAVEEIGSAPLRSPSTAASGAATPFTSPEETTVADTPMDATGLFSTGSLPAAQAAEEEEEETELDDRAAPVDDSASDLHDAAAAADPWAELATSGNVSAPVALPPSAEGPTTVEMSSAAPAESEGTTQEDEDEAASEAPSPPSENPPEPETPSPPTELSPSDPTADDVAGPELEERSESAVDTVNSSRDGRDLLDRRRGVDEVVQDDDFDF